MVNGQQNFRNLDEIAKFMEENAPDWKVRRGNETVFHSEKHADGYEVIQVTRPGDSEPFAEFWKGFYESSPEGFNGHYGYDMFRQTFVLHGDLDFAMRKVIEHLI